MSQEKVDKYKEQKANRKAIMQREKRKRIIRNGVGAVIGLALIGWLGYSAVYKYQAAQPREVAEVDYTAVTEYVNSLADTVEE